MELTKLVEDSLARWEDYWNNIDIRPSEHLHKRSSIILAFKQWWTYTRIKRLSKKCYRKFQNSSGPDTVMAGMEDDALTLMKLILNVERSECDDLVRSTYAEATKHFIDEARAFDPNMDAESVFQALRNVWIMHSIQVLHGMEPKHSKSIFGYSMLYPLTDNYLDDASVTREEKKVLNSLFRRKLEGELLEPQNMKLENVFAMVDKMASDYPREKYPDVWYSILLIQNAQENSLKQQRPFSDIAEDEIRTLSFCKGGASVLADGYLVCGELAPEWIHFLLGYGILLQLSDDLQDLYSDAEDKHWTLFSIHHQNKDVHHQIEKLRRFADDVFDSCPNNEGSSEVLLKVMKSAVDYLIFDATVNVRHNCGLSYLRTVEKQFPVNLSQQFKLNEIWKSMIQVVSPAIKY